MSLLDRSCQEVADRANARIVAVVELESGALLGVHQTSPLFNQSYLDALAAAAVDMVRGRTVLAVEQLVSHQQGRTFEKSVEELLVTTQALNHFIAVLPKTKDHAVVMVTDRKTNLGISWSHLRNALPTMEEHCATVVANNAEKSTNMQIST